MPEKLDLAKLWKADYAAPRKPVLLRLGPATYLVIEGQGEPGGSEFEAKIGSLYGMAYTIKMTRKFGGRQDYPVSKLEGQWWAADDRTCFAAQPKAAWRWKLMIRTPEFVTEEELAAARAVLSQRGKAPEAAAVHLEILVEGPCVQMLHVGPYDQEGITADIMRAFAAAQGLVPHGRHHEIYISDPRRVPPERLKTILRLPVKPTG